MKTLIIYASKKGSTKTCGEMLKQKLNGEVQIISINSINTVSLETYDKIVLGTPIYAGMFNAALKKFIEEHEALLTSKPSFLFICSMDGTLQDTYLSNNLSPNQLQAFKAITHCGGAFYFTKMNFIEKFIIKKIVKTKEPDRKIDTKTDELDFNKSAIEALASQINSCTF